MTQASTPEAVPSVAFLQSVALFTGLATRDLETAAGSFRYVEYHTGDDLMAEGEAGDRCFLIRTGRAGVTAHDEAGREFTMGQLGPGDIVGETALVRPTVRTATIRALTMVRAYALDRVAFDKLGDQVPEFYERVRHEVERRRRDALLRRVPLFASLSEGAMANLPDAVEPRLVAAFTDVVREGEAGDGFYLISQGSVEVLHGGHRVALLEEGDFFGEVALIADVPRTATVRSLEPSEVLFLPRDRFAAMVRQFDTLRAQLQELTRIRYRGAPGESLLAPNPLSTVMPFLGMEQRNRYWFLLIGGLLAFMLVSLVTAAFQAPPLLYVTVLVGALLTPAVYVTYLWESKVLPNRPQALLATFAIAAAVGVPVAFLLREPLGAEALSPGQTVLIAVVQEAAKVLAVLWLVWRRNARFITDGLVFGAAAGMGFAAVETAMLALNWTSPYISPLITLLWVQAFLGPFSHGAWSAILCAALWDAKARQTPAAWVRAGAAFVAVVALHVLWTASGAVVHDLLWRIAIALIGVVVLRFVVQAATQQMNNALLALNPQLATPQRDAPALHCRGCGIPAPAGARYCVRCGATLRLT